MSDGFDREGFLRDWFAERAGDRPIYGWATELLVHLTEDEPEVAWDLIRDLATRAPDAGSLRSLALPLEDLLRKHGPEFIGRAEALARNDGSFGRLLAAVESRNPN